MANTKEHGSGGVHIDADTFAKALERLSTEEALRAHVQKDPAKALESLGIHVSDRQRAELAGKRLHEITQGGEALAFTAPLVRIATGGTRPAINVAVSVATSAEVDNTLKQLQSKGSR